MIRLCHPSRYPIPKRLEPYKELYIATVYIGIGINIALVVICICYYLYTPHIKAYLDKKVN
jgi:hypothetical protein